MDTRGEIWIREKAVEAHEAANRAAQRSADLTTLADAIDGFWEHPNATEKDKARLSEALKRLLGG